MSINFVKIEGNLTRDPENKHTSIGKNVCTMAVASKSGYSKNGKKTADVSFFDVEVWGLIAENCVKYLKKGNGVIVEGRLKQDRWEKNGKTLNRVKIIANNVQFLAKKREEVTGQSLESDNVASMQAQSAETYVQEVID